MNLQAGDLAPDFEGKDQNGSIIRLSDYRGQNVVLYFYPKDDTPGCTLQACDLRDNHSRFEKKGYVILGVSSDSEKSHNDFIKKYNIPFTLIADTENVINRKYGVCVERQVSGAIVFESSRTTFVIDATGLIADVIDDARTEGHSAQILKEEFTAKLS